MENETFKHEEIVRKIINEQLFKQHQINESFDSPFNNFTRIDEFRYTVEQDGVSGIFTFHMLYNNNNLPPRLIYNDMVNTYYEVSWAWGRDMENSLKTPANWMRLTSTALKVIDDFIRSERPTVIKFSNRTEGNLKIYKNERFIDVLRTIFRSHYHVIPEWIDDENIVLFLINKEVSRLSESSILKRAECTNLEEATKYFKYRKKRDKKGIVRNDAVKEQKKKILYMMKYL
jgi:hypothetical protein